MEQNLPNKSADNSQPVVPPTPAAPVANTPAPTPMPVQPPTPGANQPDQVKKSPYKFIFAVILVCIVLVTAGLVYITVYKPAAPAPIANNTSDLTGKQQIIPTAPPPTEIPTPTLSPEEKIDNNLEQIDNKINSLDNSLTEAENGLNDKQTNLTE